MPSPNLPRPARTVAFPLVVAALAVPLGWQGSPNAVRAASPIEYEIVFTRETAAARTLRVVTRLDAERPGSISLSLPAWTPGAYEISNFARRVSGFTATQRGSSLDWDKTDADTWRVAVPVAGPVELGFTFAADTLDNAMAWSTADFLAVNGTNVFLYPEGGGFDFPAAVTVRTESDWRVVTGLRPAPDGRYSATSYHDLVDAPLFVGALAVDSAEIDGRWHRLASYPAGALAGAPRQMLWNQLRTVVPAMSRVFGETPWERYSTLLYFDSTYGGGSALEHADSHVGIYHTGFIGTPILASITAHEIFHAWNVKRMRPAELVPYQYDRAQPTTLLWVSEGVTDYYADLALVRGRVVDSTIFLNLVTEKMREVAEVPAVALEDASLSTWIHPVDGTATIYYPKGALAGFLLDVLIRDASDNRRSLDDVMRQLYQTTFKKGLGFTTEDWWRAATEASGGRPFTEFAERYIDGREPFPWAAVAPLAGLRFVADSISEPRIGVSMIDREGGETVVTGVVPGSAAADAGIRVGDLLVSVGSIPAGPSFGAAFRLAYGRRIGEKVPVAVRREGREVTLSLEVRAAVRVEQRLEFDRRASLKAARIRNGLLRGVTDRP